MKLSSASTFYNPPPGQLLPTYAKIKNKKSPRGGRNKHMFTVKTPKIWSSQDSEEKSVDSSPRFRSKIAQKNYLKPTQTHLRKDKSLPTLELKAFRYDKLGVNAKTLRNKHNLSMYSKMQPPITVPNPN